MESVEKGMRIAKTLFASQFASRVRLATVEKKNWLVYLKRSGSGSEKEESKRAGKDRYRGVIDQHR